MISFSRLNEIHVSMRSLVNTPPSVRYSWSFSRLSITVDSEVGACGMLLASSGGNSYRSLSMGSPGSILFLIPSRPAIIIAANARYGLPELSGQRNSRRLAFAFSPVIGMRTHAERLRWLYTRLIGASYPGTRRLYEFTVGLVKASSDGAWCRMPPM